jgi:DNA (cytosine-5)-methyltransferase 1
MTINRTKDLIPVVDLFAGPGGLGEGFSSLRRERHERFRIVISAEMERSAHETLRLRAYYRLLSRNGAGALRPYYRFCNGEALEPFDESSRAAWIEAGIEAQRLTLGDQSDNKRLDEILQRAALGRDAPWILIGGPPCQAYSLVGRSRNMGKSDYKAEEDHRHFLYKEYLRIIQEYRPDVFVMENVKGILSSSVGGERIFNTILRDLADPDRAVGRRSSRGGYRIHSLSCETRFDRSTRPDEIDPRDFIVRAEDYGIPQARHRVILLGVREDLDVEPMPLTKSESRCTVADAIGDLPHLRSRLSRQEDSSDIWAKTVNRYLTELRDAATLRPEMEQVLRVLNQYVGCIPRGRNSGGLRLTQEGVEIARPKMPGLSLTDGRLKVWLNHESRSHMAQDLCRYVYASAFAKAKGWSPAGHEEFSLIESLRPHHQNWESGKFKDRFRVQLAGTPATTITSHIAKDGHYFIHYDPAQCRSLTVREAARLQTFPDNYFFQGNRTEQYHQVGNAVPPRLAQKIARVVDDLIRTKYPNRQVA